MRLKDKQEYIDLYDKLTVEDCRWRQNFHNNYQPSEELLKGGPPEMYKPINDIALYFDLSSTVVRRYNEKENKIKEWMDRDAKKTNYITTLAHLSL